MRAALIDFHFFAYTVQLANALAEHCDVTLMLPEQTPESYTSALKKQIDLRPFHLPGRMRYPTCAKMVYSLFRTISKVKASVVHQLDGHLWLNAALPLLPDVPLVTTSHDVASHPGDKESIDWFYSWLWKRAEQVIVHAETLKRQLVEGQQVSAERVHVIPHGTYDFYKTWASDRAAEREGTVLFFGRIWEYKGLQYLIEAEPAISARVPNARIVIAGHGEPFEKYERLMVNRDRFVVHNYRIPDEMVAQLFQEASLVVLPYTEASQSGVAAIAYAFGKPVVATTVGGIPEVVHHAETGYLVPPRDAASLGDAIVTLLQDRELRHEMGRRALGKAESDLSWSSIAEKTLQVYRRAITSYSGR